MHWPALQTGPCNGPGSQQQPSVQLATHLPPVARHWKYPMQGLSPHIFWSIGDGVVAGVGEAVVLGEDIAVFGPRF
ncbi:MAG: hypothetical protein ACP5I3_10730 [Thermoproteus sp.]